MADETTIKTDELKPIKITTEANRAIEAYLGWQRGIGEEITKQDVLEDAVLFFVGNKMPSALLKVYGLTTEKKTAARVTTPAAARS